jgi:hypothetical protein
MEKTKLALEGSNELLNSLWTSSLWWNDERWAEVLIIFFISSSSATAATEQ